jgi:fimbrial isopeptide formation D2 family protein
VIIDILPQAVEFVSATGDGRYGAYDRTTHTYTWTYASLEAGASGSVDLVVRLSENATPGAVITNRATIRSAQTPDTNKGTDITVAYEPLEVAKTVLNPSGGVDDRGRPCVSAGAKIVYQITLRNPSKDVAISQIVITDEMPPEITFVTADGNGDYGYYDSITHTFTWNYSLLTAGAEASLKLEGYVSEAVEPNTVLVNAVTVTSKQAAPSRARADAVICARAIEAQMFLKPTIIWRNHTQATPDLMVVVHLPEGYGMGMVAETPLVLTPGNVQSSTPKIYGTSQQGKILCFFDTAPLLAATQGFGEFDIEVTGKLTNGRSFVCKGKVAIMRFGGP